MNSLVLLGVCFIAWLAWVPAVLTQKAVRGDTGSTSVLPVIPLCPLVGWGVGVALNAIKPGAGLFVVGGLHVVLFVVFLGSVFVSAIKIKTRKSRTTGMSKNSARRMQRTSNHGRAED